MRTITSVQLDKPRPALILTRQSALPRLSWVTVAPITSTVRGISSEVPVGPRPGLDHDSIVTVRREAVYDTIGLLFDDQERELARAVGEAFELVTW